VLVVPLSLRGVVGGGVLKQSWFLGDVSFRGYCGVGGVVNAFVSNR